MKLIQELLQLNEEKEPRIVITKEGNWYSATVDGKKVDVVSELHFIMDHLCEDGGNLYVSKKPAVLLSTSDEEPTLKANGFADPLDMLESLVTEYNMSGKKTWASLYGYAEQTDAAQHGIIDLSEATQIKGINLEDDVYEPHQMDVSGDDIAQSKFVKEISKLTGADAGTVLKTMPPISRREKAGGVDNYKIKNKYVVMAMSDD